MSDVRPSVEALADAWASIDGKLEAFRRERDMFASDVPVDRRGLGYTGHYEGYTAEAEEMIRRLRKRGYVLCPVS